MIQHKTDDPQISQMTQIEKPDAAHFIGTQQNLRNLRNPWINRLCLLEAGVVAWFYCAGPGWS
jgi:hypothetical protein